MEKFQGPLELPLLEHGKPFEVVALRGRDGGGTGRDGRGRRNRRRSRNRLRRGNGRRRRNGRARNPGGLRDRPGGAAAEQQDGQAEDRGPSGSLQKTIPLPRGVSRLTASIGGHSRPIRTKASVSSGEYWLPRTRRRAWR